MLYKEGDKVKIKSLDWYNENKDKDDSVICLYSYFDKDMSKFCDKIVTIKSLHGCHNVKAFRIIEDDGYSWWSDDMIEGLVEEEEIEFTEEDKYWCDIMSESDPTTYVLPQGYQFKDENGNVINAQKIVLEKKKKEYPQSYEECCQVLEYIPHTDDIIGYKWDVLQSLQKLLICRDAYWKIAGEEMGLGKDLSWVPDWMCVDRLYAILYRYHYICKAEVNGGTSCILAFPTIEMRDVFYENFKDLIEQCKELL